MDWDFAFRIANYWAMAFWVVLAFLPRKPLTMSFIMYGGIAVLALSYVLLLASLWSGRMDPGGAVAQVDFARLSGIMGMFATKGWMVLGWVHYLCFDLFVGLWIARDADGKGIGRIWQVPILLATFMFGPVGLLLWLIAREPAARRTART